MPELGRRTPTGGGWRLIDTPPAPGAWNMAVDEALLRSVAAGAPPVLRFYRWTPRCISLGRNQPAAEYSDVPRAGLDVVRRPTGGRAVAHDDDLTYSVIVGQRALGSPRAAYRLINEVLLIALLRLGAPAALHPAGGRSSPPLTPDPCFADPVAGEIVAGGRKLMGSAQVRLNGVLLQQGSMPLRASPSCAPDHHALASLRSSPVYLQTLVNPLPDWREMRDAVVRAWADRNGPVAPAALAPAEIRDTERLTARYLSEEWTWRR